MLRAYPKWKIRCLNKLLQPLTVSKLYSPLSQLMAWTQLNNLFKGPANKSGGSRIWTYECLKHSAPSWLSNAIVETIWMMSQASHLPQIFFLENLHQSWLSSVIHPCYSISHRHTGILCSKTPKHIFSICFHYRPKHSPSPTVCGHSLLLGLPVSSSFLSLQCAILPRTFEQVISFIWHAFPALFLVGFLWLLFSSV